jgi:hypothetical protein
MWQHLKSNVGKMQHLLGEAATIMEIMSSLWSWSDSKATAIAITCIGLASLTLSLILYTFPLRWVLFLLSLPWCTWIIIDSVQREEHAQNTGIAHDEAKLRQKGNARSKFVLWVKNYVARVPDALELEHRYIAQTAVVRDARRLKDE